MSWKYTGNIWIRKNSIHNVLNVLIKHSFFPVVETRVFTLKIPTSLHGLRPNTFSMVGLAYIQIAEDICMEKEEETFKILISISPILRWKYRVKRVHRLLPKMAFTWLSERAKRRTKKRKKWFGNCKLNIENFIAISSSDIQHCWIQNIETIHNWTILNIKIEQYLSSYC